MGAIKRGTFTLKSGAISPIYVDLRTLIGYPELLEKMADLLYERAKGLQFDQICGVPYSALPIATLISVKHRIPLCIRRKERKAHGTGRLIEGVYKEGDRVLVLEDVVTSGASVMETVKELREAGLIVEDVICFLDREAEGRDMKGIRLHSVITLKELLK